MVIRIADNSTENISNSPESEIEDLKRISDISLRDAEIANPNILIFPNVLGEYGDDIGKECICSIAKEQDKTLLSTGNLMGFVGTGDTELTICSRFTGTDRTDFFLHYMLQKVFCPNLFDWKHSYKELSVFDFLLYLFPYYLNQALSQGLFKEYRRIENNDSRVKGTIDISRHIRNNTPFTGRIAYNTREFCHDNRITQLIRHTIEYVSKHELGEFVLESDETKESVRLIVNNTPSYCAKDRSMVIEDNVKEVKHPYFTAYTILQQICLQILRHDGLKYGDDKDKVYGILFDGAWLWEEYLSTVLTDYIHPKNKEGKGAIYLFDNEKDENGIVTARRHCRRYPDFYKKASGTNDAVILDAKYKHLESGYIDRDDMHQIISYMYVEKATLGGLIYPIENKKAIESQSIGKLRGYGGDICTYGMPIPQADDFDEFVKQMDIFEKTLRKIT